jgi:hypothetical protein
LLEPFVSLRQWKLTATPGAEENFDRTGAAIMNDESVFVKYIVEGNESIWAG